MALLCFSTSQLANVPLPFLVNPPEAIRNLVTSVVTPRSARPGFFNPSGHTTVGETGLFFLTHFAPGRQWSYYGVTDQVRSMVTNILCQKSDRKKNLVCKTVACLLMLKKHGPWDQGMVTGGLGEKPEHRHPSSIKTSHYWWRTDIGVKIVTFRIVTNTMARNGKGRIQLFNVWHQHQEKKRSWIRPLPFHTIAFAAIQKAPFLTPASVAHQ